MFVQRFLGKEGYQAAHSDRNPDRYLLLDFCERTIPLPSHVKEKIGARQIDMLERDFMVRYPEYGEINSQVAGYAGVSSENVLLTNGSDHAIGLIFSAVLEGGSKVVIPAPTFAMFRHSAEVQGAEIIEPEYSLKYGYPFEEVRQAARAGAKLVVVCNPNNPTGTSVARDQILALAAAVPDVAIMVDECYFEFSGITVVDAVNQYPNLFVTRTFSKSWGLAGYRIGYIISCAKNIRILSSIRGPFDVNPTAVAAVSVVLANSTYVTDYVDEVCCHSLPLMIDFLRENGIEYWPTAANFVLFKAEDGPGLAAQLKERGILVSPRKGPGIANTIRATLGTAEQTQKLIDQLKLLL